MNNNLQELESRFEKDFNNLQALDELLADFKATFAEVIGDEQDKADLLDELQKQHSYLKNNNQEEDWNFDYDFSKYNAQLKPIEKLNTNNLSYPLFLRDVVIPNFFPLPHPEIQNSILATICLLNSASLPPEGSHGKSEVLLPTIYIQGQSGSGKSEIAGLLQNHYPPKRRKSIKGSDTGGSLVEQLTNACHRSGTIDEENIKLYPAIAILENFYFKNLDRWKDWSVQLLATNREMSQFQRKGQDPRDFITYLLKVFTSVEPLQAVKQQHSELLRRTIRIFTKQDNPEYNSSVYNWEYCKNQYKKLWQSVNVENEYLILLQQVQTKNPDNSPIPNNWYPPSVMLIATGVYSGIWKSIEEAENHIAKYWELVNEQENKRGKAYIELFKDILESYHREVKHLIEQGNDERDAKKSASSLYLNADKMLSRAISLHGNFYSKREINESLLSYMESKGFIYTTNNLKTVNLFYDSTIL